MFIRLIVLAGLLIAAVSCYLINFQTGTVIALVAGVLFESAFWLNLFGGRKSSRSAKDE